MPPKASVFSWTSAVARTSSVHESDDNNSNTNSMISRLAVPPRSSKDGF